jgi:hypothetical protein
VLVDQEEHRPARKAVAAVPAVAADYPQIIQHILIMGRLEEVPTMPQHRVLLLVVDQVAVAGVLLEVAIPDHMQVMGAAVAVAKPLKPTAMMLIFPATLVQFGGLLVELGQLVAYILPQSLIVKPILISEPML